MNFRKLTDYPLFIIPFIVWFTYQLITEPSFFRGLALLIMIIIGVVTLVLTRIKKTEKKSELDG